MPARRPAPNGGAARSLRETQVGRVAQQAADVGQGDCAEQHRDAGVQDAVGEHRGGGGGQRHAVQDEHADQAALGAAGDRDHGAAVTERVGQHQQADGQTGRANRMERGGKCRDVEREVSDRAGDHEAVPGAQQLGARSDAVAQVLARLRERGAHPPGGRARHRAV